MIEVSETYRAAITAQSRRTLLRAAVDMISPNFSYGTITSSGASIMSKAAQLHDKVTELGTPTITLENNRWLLGKAYLARGLTNNTEHGWESDVLSGADGSCSAWVEMGFSGVKILQSLTVYWPDNDIDGLAADFTVEVKQGGNVYFSTTITGNTSSQVSITDFTVYNPDAIRVTVTRWSLPSRRVRIPEIWPGYHEVWDGDMLAAFSVSQQGDFKGLSLPYGTCTLTVDNADRRFEPTSKDGLFRSIEERQGIEIAIGANDSELVPVGKYYQYSGGWKTGANSLTMTWNLVDIIGLLVDREYVVPDGGLPTTLETWVASIVAQLGSDFAGLYDVDEDYADIALTTTLERVKGQKCGQILLWICQATQTWPRATWEGKLRVGGLGTDGGSLTLDNLESYPQVSANDDLARLDFTLADGTTLSIPGNSSSSPNTVSINNPFLTTAAQAQTAAAHILRFYGGAVLETTGRGDPSGELGDPVTTDTGNGAAMAGRILYQTFEISDGVMRGCKTRLLAAEMLGSGSYDKAVVLTGSGTFDVPEDLALDEEDAGILYLILVGGGQGGGGGVAGRNATLQNKATTGANGTDGDGGRVWFGTLTVQSGQSFAYTAGQGGGTAPAGAPAAINGTASTFASLSSAYGVIYAAGYLDLLSGAVLARAGQPSPAAHSGDGGKGGRGGAGSSGYLDGYIEGPYADIGIGTVVGTWVLNGDGTAPTPGTAGADGCILVYYKQREE